MTPRRRRPMLAVLLLLPGIAAIFWLTAVATSGLPNTAIFAINVHGLTLNDPTTALRPAPLSLSVLDDARLDAQDATASPSATPATSLPGTTAPVTRPTPAPTRVATPTPTPSATGSVLPLPSPSVPTPSPAPTITPGIIAGQVIDSQTKSPIAGAAVSMTPPAAIGLTDSNGNFALIVAPGSYTVTVTAAGYNSASQSVTVKSGQRQTLSFKLTSMTASGSVAGNVSDASSGIPIPGAMVTLSNGLATVTDLNGNFSFAVVLDGSYTLTVSATNYVAQSIPVTVKTAHISNVSVNLVHA